MGEYIYKAKVEKFNGTEEKIGFYDFWYKPVFAWETPRWQTRFETIAETFEGKHPEGVRYAAIAPTSGEDDIWDKEQYMALYKVPEGVHFGVVSSDMSRSFETVFNFNNVIGLIRGPKNGKKVVDTSALARRTAVLMNTPNNNIDPELLKEMNDAVMAEIGEDKTDLSIFKGITKLYHDTEKVSIRQIFSQHEGWRGVQDEPLTKYQLILLKARRVTHINLSVIVDGGYEHCPDYSVNELMGFCA